MIDPHGFWLEILESNKHCCDESLLKMLIKIFDVSTVVDIGCGDGSYTKGFIEKGIDCIGYDGNPLTPELTGGLCGIKDFSQKVNIGKFDLVLSLEVGEHIPLEYEQVFIDNICRSSKKWICLSWGIPGQPGYGHVNCKSNEYVISEMTKRGFIFDKKRSNKLRDKSIFDWFKNSIMVFHGLEK